MFRGFFGSMYRKGAGLTPTAVDDQGNGLPVSGTVTAAASENHLGEVGGASASVTATPTLTTGSAYATGQMLGGKLTLSGATRIAAGSGIIESLLVSDKANQKSALDVVFWIADPTNTTFTDKTTLAVNAADLVNIVGTVSVAGSDYVGFSANAVASKSGVALKFRLPSGSSLFAALVCRGTPTWVGASDLQLRVEVMQD